MRLRQLVIACGLASMALSSQVSALGLGEVKLKSTLNQPLEAEVKLLDTRDLTAEQILVTLASPADFERNGVDRLFFYTEFQFTVDLESPDGPKVLITSRNPVREPYLNFLVEARWTAGRLLREYTLLMDLPTFDEDAARAPVQTATTAATRQQQPRQQSASPTSSSNSVRASRPASGSSTTAAKPRLSGNEYEVRNNDTLWEIALRARPDSSVSVHQSMMALYKANPEAFISGNINRLRRGQVLRVPDADEMKSLNKSEALSQFNAASNGDSSFGAQINASRRTSGTRTESTEVSGRVKLAAPASTNTSGQGSGANDGSGKALESELAATLEELDKSRAENTELSSRVRDLEAQIDTMQRLVDVSNEKLRALQVAAEQQSDSADATQPRVEPAPEQAVSSAQAAEESVAPIVAPEPVPQEQVAASVAQVEPASSVAASSEPAVVPPPPAQPTNKVVTRPKPEPSLVDKAIENAPWIGLIVLALAGAGYLVYRRRRDQAEEEQALGQEDVFAFNDTTTPAEQAVDTPDFNDIDETSLFEEEQDTASAVAETGDVVSEADIYIAYGNLDQAEEILLNALNKDPDSSEIRMKLLEVYALKKDASAFDKHYALLLPIAGAALIARASELRSGIPGAGEFGGDVSAASEQDDFAFDDLNLDDDLSVTDEAPGATNYQASDFDFTLDLDEEDAAVSNLDSGAAPAEGDLSFDLPDSELKTDDDLSELSLALNELDKNELPDDVEVSSTKLDQDFSFDLDEDLALGEQDGDLTASFSRDDEIVLDKIDATEELQTGNLIDENADSLDIADDFNLDMDVGNVDLAALDHEIEGLDDLDDEELTDITEDTASISEFAAQEIAKDQEEPDLDLDDEMHLEDISPANLSLTDDFDNRGEDVDFTLDDEKALDAELEADFAELDKSSGALNDQDLEFDLESGDFDSVDDVVVDNGATYAEASSSSTESSNNQAGHGIDDADLQDEDLFSQALSEFSPESDELDLNEFSSDEAALANLSDDEMDSELDFLADADEAATKLDLARAYIDMGDTEGAKDILSEVINEGNDDQRKEAGELLGRIV